MKTLHLHNEEMEKEFDEYYPELLTEAGEVRNDVKNFITNSNKQLYIKIAEGEIERLSKDILWTDYTLLKRMGLIKIKITKDEIRKDWIFKDKKSLLVTKRNPRTEYKLEQIDYWNNILQELNK